MSESQSNIMSILPATRYQQMLQYSYLSKVRENTSCLRFDFSDIFPDGADFLNTDVTIWPIKLSLQTDRLGEIQLKKQIVCAFVNMRGSL